MPWSGIAGSYVSSIFSFLRNLLLFSIAVVPVYIGRGRAKDRCDRYVKKTDMLPPIVSEGCLWQPSAFTSVLFSASSICLHKMTSLRLDRDLSSLTLASAIQSAGRDLQETKGCHCPWGWKASQWSPTFCLVYLTSLTCSISNFHTCCLCSFSLKSLRKMPSCSWSQSRIFESVTLDTSLLGGRYMAYVFSLGPYSLDLLTSW